MEWLSIILGFAGLVIALAGFAMVLFAAFDESIAWGLLCLLVPGIVLVFAITNWHSAKKGIRYYIIGVVVCVIGIVLQSRGL